MRSSPLSEVRARCPRFCGNRRPDNSARICGIKFFRPFRNRRLLRRNIRDRRVYTVRRARFRPWVCILRRWKRGLLWLLKIEITMNRLL